MSAKQPRPVPTNQVKPEPPPPPPRKKADLDLWTCDVHQCSRCSQEWRSVPNPPKPVEPPLRILKEGHIPPREASHRLVDAPSSNSMALWLVVISAISFILGVSFAEWTR